MIRFLLLIMLGTLLGAADLVDVNLPVWKFSGDEAWSVWWPSSDPQPFLVDHAADGARLTLTGSDKELQLPFLDGRFREQLNLGSPSRFVLDVDLEAGNAASIGLNLIDSAGMAGHFPERALVPGRNRVEWDLTAAPENTWGKTHAGVLTPPLHLWDVQVKRPAGEEVRLHFISGSGVERRRLVDCTYLSLETGSPIHVLIVGRERELALNVANTAEQAQHMSLASTWEDWNGRRQNATGELDVPAHGEVRWTPPVTIDRRGAWKIECVLTDAAGQHREERFWLAHLDQPVKRSGRTSGFLFGVNGGLVWPGHEAELVHGIDALVNCGARVTRGGINWEYVQQEPGKWRDDWFPWFASELKRLDAVGIECQFLLCYTTKWAAPAATRNAADMTEWLFAPPEPDAWRGYVQEMATRFHQQIRYWEVWNETDITNFWPGTNDQYLEILRIAHETLKRIDPQLQVMTSGFAILAGHGGHKDPDFTKKVVTKGRSSFDIFTLHLHGNFSFFKMQLDELLPPLTTACVPSAPLYFNETAVNVDEVGEHGQAEQLAKKLLYAWGKGAIGYTWYNLSSGKRVTIPGGDVNWGLMTEDWYPRPAYSAFATLATRLSSATCGGFVSAPAGRIVIKLADADALWLAGWDEDLHLSAGPQVVTIGAGATATAIDLMGDEQELAVLDGKVLWPIGRIPGLLRVRGATAELVLERPLIAPVGAPLAMPGRPCDVQVTIRNPRAVPQAFALHWRLPAAWGGGDTGSEAITLTAGEERAVTHRITVPTSGPRWGDTPLLDLGFELTGTPWTGTAGVPLSVGLIVPEGPFNRSPDLVLDQRSQVINLNENVPQRGHLMWRGPEDLSAQCWLGRDGDHLKMRVIVRDDIHRQPYSAGDIWKADSIQFAFSFPGQEGWWEMGMAQRDDGALQALMWIKPRGCQDEMGKARIATHRDGDLLTYEWDIPLAVLGTDAAQLHAGFGFNLVVNDDDTGEREGWLQLAPGIAEHKDPKGFIQVRCE